MVHKERRIDGFHWVWLSRNEGDLYSLEIVYEPAKMLALLDDCFIFIILQKHTEQVRLNPYRYQTALQIPFW